jgi:hypothetical protein
MGESSGMGSEWIFAFLIIAVIFGGFGGGFGGNNAAMAGFATIADVNASNAAQTSQLNQQSILLSSANNNYEMSRQLADQNMFMTNQNNANATNILQGFNALQMQIANQTSTLGSKLDQLGFNMEQCCCSIKTLIKDNQIAELTNQLNNANNIAVNSAQSQYLLGQMGKWVANASATA